MLRQVVGNIFEHGGSDEHLFEITDSVGEAIATRLVEFGEDVIENEDGVAGG